MSYEQHNPQHLLVALFVDKNRELPFIQRHYSNFQFVPVISFNTAIADRFDFMEVRTLFVQYNNREKREYLYRVYTVLN